MTQPTGWERLCAAMRFDDVDPGPPLFPQAPSVMPPARTDRASVSRQRRVWRALARITGGAA